MNTYNLPTDKVPQSLQEVVKTIQEILGQKSARFSFDWCSGKGPDHRWSAWPWLWKGYLERGLRHLRSRVEGIWCSPGKALVFADFYAYQDEAQADVQGIQRNCGPEKRSNYISSPGLFGSFQWIDNQKKTAGFLMTFYLNNKGRHEYYQELKKLVDETLN